MMTNHSHTIGDFVLFIVMATIGFAIAIGICIWIVCGISFLIKDSINERKYELIWDNMPDLLYKNEIYILFSKEEEKISPFNNYTTRKLYYVPKNDPVDEKKVYINSNIMKDISIHIEEEKQLTPYRGELAG